MNEQKTNITNEAQDDNSGRFELLVNLRANFISTEERLSLVCRELSGLIIKRKHTNDFNDQTYFKAKVKSIIGDLLAIYEKM